MSHNLPSLLLAQCNMCFLRKSVAHFPSHSRSTRYIVTMDASSKNVRFLFQTQAEATIQEAPASTTVNFEPTNDPSQESRQTKNKDTNNSPPVSRCFSHKTNKCFSHKISFSLILIHASL